MNTRAIDTSLGRRRIVRAMISSLAVAILASGCSSVSPAAPEPLERSCCVDGYIHTCQSAVAGDRCVASSDTTDCTKTARPCGNGVTSGPVAISDAGQNPQPVPNGDAAGPKKGLGQACRDSSECEFEFCSAAGNICTKTCQRDQDCPNSWKCISGSNTKVCYPVGNGRTGDECASLVDCVSLLCLIEQGKTRGYCSENCTTPQQCPAGWACAQTNITTSRVCVQP
jgi:hypothetical protein